MPAPPRGPHPRKNTQMRPSEIRAEIDRDLTGYSRDVLEFNYRLLARHAVDWVDMIEKQHAAQLANIRAHADAGAFLTENLTRLAAAGRKTVRIDEILADAERRLAAMHAREGGQL